MSTRLTERLTALAEHELIAGAATNQFEQFAAALWEFGTLAGNYFAPTQGGRFSHPQAEAVVSRLQEAGVVGIAQSSWGPTLCAAVPTEAFGRSVLDRMSLPAGSLRMTRPQSRSRPDVDPARGCSRGTIGSNDCLERQATSDRVEGLLQVADDVVHIFGPDRQAHEVGGHAGALLLFQSQLLVRRAVGVDDQRLAVADVGQVREELHAVDQLDAVRRLLRRRGSGDAEAEDGTGPLGRYFLPSAYDGVRLQTGVVDPTDLLVAFQELAPRSERSRSAVPSAGAASPALAATSRH